MLTFAFLSLPLLRKTDVKIRKQTEKRETKRKQETVFYVFLRVSSANIGKFNLSLKALILSAFAFICFLVFSNAFRRTKIFHDILKIESAEYNLPGVIYEAGENRLNVYAYTDVELTDNSDLFAAPFFNVTGASVCLGSAKIEKPKDLTYTNLLEYWEKRFWLTEFSHLGGGGNPTKSNLVLVTKAAKDKPFDLDELQPLKKLKLKDILR